MKKFLAFSALLLLTISAQAQTVKNYVVDNYGDAGVLQGSVAVEQFGADGAHLRQQAAKAWRR